MWVWVLSFTLIGNKPEHGLISKFETKQECILALQQKKQEAVVKNKELVGSCYLTKLPTKG